VGLQILNSRDIENCIPLYLRPDDRTCAPVLSHNSPCTNVLLKITVPKRTGRKRKRGSQDPYVEDSNDEVSASSGLNLPNGQSPELRSHSRLDNPRKILRILKDNIGKYVIEPAGSIETTHRYRGLLLQFLVSIRILTLAQGLADFHQSTTHQNFMAKFRDTILTGKCKPSNLSYLSGPY
jgi:general transcription factor 3C polypeptide 5 (transcription factor C subunit 1)